MSVHSEVAVAATSSGDHVPTAQGCPLRFRWLPSRRWSLTASFSRQHLEWNTMKSVNTEDDECKLLSTESQLLSLQNPPRTHTQRLTPSRESHTGRGERRQKTALTMRTWLESSCFNLIPPTLWVCSPTCQSYACDTQPKLFCVPCPCRVPWEQAGHLVHFCSPRTQ